MLVRYSRGKTMGLWGGVRCVLCLDAHVEIDRDVYIFIYVCLYVFLLLYIFVCLLSYPFGAFCFSFTLLCILFKHLVQVAVCAFKMCTYVSLAQTSPSNRLVSARSSSAHTCAMVAKHEPPRLLARDMLP